MTISHGVPGHDNGTASVRLRMGELKDDPAGGPGAWDLASIGPYEVICPACGDNPDLNYSEVSPELQALRGNYATSADALEALAVHIGIQR